MISPAGTSGSLASVRRPGRKPESSSAARKSSSRRPLESGTGTGESGTATSRSTVSPGSRTVPAAGSWLSTVSGSASSVSTALIRTIRFRAAASSSACSSERPWKSGVSTLRSSVGSADGEDVANGDGDGEPITSPESNGRNSRRTIPNATMKAPTRMPPTSRTGVPSSGGSSLPPDWMPMTGAATSTGVSGAAARAASAASVASGSGATGVVVHAAPTVASAGGSRSASLPASRVSAPSIADAPSSASPPSSAGTPSSASSACAPSSASATSVPGASVACSEPSVAASTSSMGCSCSSTSWGEVSSTSPVSGLSSVIGADLTRSRWDPCSPHLRHREHSRVRCQFLHRPPLLASLGSRDRSAFET